MDEDVQTFFGYG